MSQSMRVLVVDDEPEVRAVLARMLLHLGHEVSTASDGPQALHALETRPYDAIVCDQRMPGMSGLEVLIEAARQHPHVARLMLTAHAHQDLAIDALNEARVDVFLKKPVSIRDLTDPLEAAVLRHRSDVAAWRFVADAFLRP